MNVINEIKIRNTKIYKIVYHAFKVVVLTNLYYLSTGGYEYSSCPSMTRPSVHISEPTQVRYPGHQSRPRAIPITCPINGSTNRILERTIEEQNFSTPIDVIQQIPTENMLQSTKLIRILLESIHPRYPQIESNPNVQFQTKTQPRGA